ncbi:MAG: hypothetical protein HS115_17925 [Spirochaetales bacterium]|nr:hypothetical protein [Spirochaetales bacterium]
MKHNYYSNFFFLCCLILPFLDCRTTKKGLEQVKNISRWKGCIAIDLPVITLTPERTQAERQLIGKETELEADGWLISTPVSVSRQNGSALRNPDRSVLLLYEEAVQKFKDYEILGEAKNGQLALLPERLTPAPRTGQAIQLALRIAGQVNQSRQNLARAGQLIDYRSSLRPGQWFESDQGEWQIKR